MLVVNGYVRVACDYGVWIWKGEVVLVVHVDDMQMFGTRDGMNRFIEVLEAVFIRKRLVSTGEEPFLSLRVERDRSNRRIILS